MSHPYRYSSYLSSSYFWPFLFPPFLFLFFPEDKKNLRRNRKQRHMLATADLFTNPLAPSPSRFPFPLPSSPSPAPKASQPSLSLSVIVAPSPSPLHFTHTHQFPCSWQSFRALVVAAAAATCTNIGEPEHPFCLSSSEFLTSPANQSRMRELLIRFYVAMMTLFKLHLIE